MKGMIFTTESVRAILDGHKTQTRRVVKFGKPQPEHGEIIENENGVLKVDTGRTIHTAKSDKQVGNILYVKETWCTDDNMSDVFEESLTHGFYYKADALDMDWVNAYAELWDNANKKHGHGWNTNPWVWVYTFERTEKEKE